MSKSDNTATVTLGDVVVTIRRRGRSSAEVARILGLERDPDGGIHKIVLDRIVHGYHETVMGEWRVGGALVSVLTRAPETNRPTV